MPRKILTMMLLITFFICGCSIAEPAVSYEWKLTEIPKGVNVEVGQTQFYTAQFSNGLLPVMYKSDSRYYAAYLRTDGTLLRGLIFDWGNTYAFSEGCGYVEMDSKAKGFVDVNGIKLFDLIYKKDGKKYAYSTHPGKFSEGLVCVSLSVKNGSRRIGYLDKLGNVVIDPLDHNWESGFPFKYGTAIVCDSKNCYSLIDTEGNVLISFKQNEIPLDCTPNGCIVQNTDSMEITIVNRKGKKIFSVGNVSQCIESNGLIAAITAWSPQENRVFDASGKVIADIETLAKLGMDKQISRISGLLDGMIVFKGKYNGQGGTGLMSPDGKIVCAPIPRHVPLADGYSTVAEESGYGISDWDGNEIVPCRFEEMSPLTDGACLVKKNGNGYILTVTRITEKE